MVQSPTRLCTLISTQPGFEAMTSRSLQNTSCPRGVQAHPNHLFICDQLRMAMLNKIMLDYLFHGTYTLDIYTPTSAINAFNQCFFYASTLLFLSSQYSFLAFSLLMAFGVIEYLQLFRYRYCFHLT